MSDPEIYPVPADLAARAHMDRAGYDAARIAARETPDAYWGEQAKRLDWMTFPSKIKDVSFNKEDFRIRWFEDGVLNVSAECIDRHLPHRENDTAIIWEGDEPTDSEHVTYGQLHERVCRMANVLKAHGVTITTSGYGNVFGIWLGATAPGTYEQAARAANPRFTLALHLALREAGLLMMPSVAAAMGMKFLSAPILKRFGFRRVLTLNTVMIGVTISLFSFVIPGTPIALIVLLGLLCC